MFMEKVVNSILNSENLIFFYQHTTDEIHHTQKQKWSITYYCLILNIAVFVVFKLLESDIIRFFEQVVLFSLSIIITMGGVLYLVFTQRLLVDYHVRLRRIYKNLPEDKYVILEKQKFNQTTFSFQVSNVILPYIMVLFFACVIVIYLIFR
jgi:uncharacterized membrane protein